MKGQIIFFGKLILIWLIVFLFQRLLFIFHFWSDFSGNFGELIVLPFHTIRLDLSAIGYLTGISFVLSFFSFFMGEKGLRYLQIFIHFYFWVIFTLAALVVCAEIVTYIEWKTKLSSKIFIHLTTPSEVFRTASFSYTVWFFFYLVLQVVFGYFVYVKLFKKNAIKILVLSWKKRIIYGFSYLILGATILVLFIRGGLQQIPVSSTDAYFSKKQIVNDVSVNPVWSFIHTCYVHFKVDLSVYFQNVDPTEGERIMNELYASEQVDSVKILDVKRPNIILVTLEGWSAQMIEPLGGEPKITPNFNKLCSEGLLFTNFYANGGTSETGISSIISGYPTISGISISTESAKCRQLPSLNQSLKKEGYNSFYAFGGSLSYGNIGGYLTDVGFDRVVDEKDLDLTPKGKLGIHDEAMFAYFLTEIQNAKRPYFYNLFTQSTHSPYDMPAPPFPGYNNDGYVTSMNYADKHLGIFAEALKKLPDFENTLVIFVADHGRANIFNEDTYSEKYFHIPLLFWGGALKSAYAGVKNDKVGSQADLAKTLLHQLKIYAHEFHWSKDLFNPTSKAWAICTSTLSYGWKDQDGYTVYHMIDQRLISSPYSDQNSIDLALLRCRSVIEAQYREFVKL